MPTKPHITAGLSSQKMRLPAFRRKSNRPHLAVVTLSDGVTRKRKDFILGRYDDPASREAYLRILAEWERNGRRLPETSEVKGTFNVSDLCLAFWRYAQSYHTRTKCHDIRQALRILRLHHGNEPAIAFGPKKLRDLREPMMRGLPGDPAAPEDNWRRRGRRPWSRRTINDRIKLIRHVFKWAAGEELVPVDVFQALQCVEPLRAGKTEAAESRGRQPVQRSTIRRISRLVSPQVRALIRLQLLTGARPSELLGLRPVDIDTSNEDVWTATLDEHKTAWKGKGRVLYFGPRAQRVLNQFMTTGRPLNATLFNPMEAPGKAGAAAKADCYSPDTYRRAIARACKAARVPTFSPYALRHMAATTLRAEFGEEAAALILGHARIDTTQLYGERNHHRAREVVSRIG